MRTLTPGPARPERPVAIADSRRRAAHRAWRSDRASCSRSCSHWSCRDDLASGVAWRLITFTYQANILAAAYYAWTLFSPRADARTGLRGAVVLYVVVAGVVWNLLLTGHSMGYTPANFLLHVVVPVLAVADWLLVGRGRHPVRWWQPHRLAGLSGGLRRAGARGPEPASGGARRTTSSIPAASASPRCLMNVAAAGRRLPRPGLSALPALARATSANA